MLQRVISVGKAMRVMTKKGTPKCFPLPNGVTRLGIPLNLMAAPGSARLLRQGQHSMGSKANVTQRSEPAVCWHTLGMTD